MNIYKLITLPVLGLLMFSGIVAQNITIEGYVFESGNRGFLNVVQMDIRSSRGQLLGTTFTDVNGYFSVEVAKKDNYQLTAFKDMFESMELELDAKEVAEGGKLFSKIKMKRAPGYQFEITLAEKRAEKFAPRDAIKGARIEVYNNTTKKEILVLEKHPHPEFNVSLLKGNHYTILVRKDGYINKRMEAFVNVEGCILCFEGIGSIEPGVSDNLSEGNQMGVLLANVELEPLFEGKTLTINNILYEVNEARLDPNERNGLNKLVILMKDNPDIDVEIGSHTDANGPAEYNMKLSKQRASNVVKYLIDKGIEERRLISRGYGETQPLNECRDGVKCTPEQHQLNRRTELKILGITASGLPVRPLSKIKKIEQGEALLEEIQFGGQIQVPLDSTQVDSTTLERIAKALETKQPVVETQTEIASEKPQEQSEVAIEQVELEVEASLRSDDTKPNPEESDRSEDSEQAIIDSSTVAVVDSPVLVLKSLLEGDKDEELVAEETVAELGDEVKEETVIENTVETPIAETKYSIVVKESETALAMDHALFEKHSNIRVLKNEVGVYLYMIGMFDTLGQAEKFYKSAAKLAYPDCYLIKEEGKTITKL